MNLRLEQSLIVTFLHYVLYIPDPLWHRQALLVLFLLLYPADTELLTLSSAHKFFCDK